MLSMSVCPGINGTLPRPTFHTQNSSASFGALKTSIQFKYQTTSGGQFPSIRYGKSRRFSATADVADFPSAIEDEDDVISVQEPEKLKVVVKAMEKPRLVLKFVWMEKNIGIGLDKVIPGHGTIPLSPYFFWPRKDAWEELKTTLESKPWISQKKMIILLNQATDIINLCTRGCDFRSLGG